MRTRHLIAILIALITTTNLSAQRSVIPTRAKLVSPELTDSQVVFRIAAPNAKEVSLHGSWMNTDDNCYGELVLDERTATIPMARDDKGIWSCSIPTPTAELYTYNFYIDGVYTTDAANPFIQRDGLRLFSVLLIPGKLTENYKEATKHGNLSQVWYPSPTIGAERRMYVYTPHGYADSDESYPVLYLLHGGGCDEDTWNSMGRACAIIDNLIEKGEAKPMIVVMPNGNATQVASPFMMIPENRPTNEMPRSAFSNKFIHSLAKDIIPYIEKHYRVIADSDHRAVSGLSMGGGHTLSVTSAYPGLFGYIAPMGCGARRSDEFIAGLQGIKKAGYKLYWLGCGTNDFAYPGAKILDELLTENEMPHTFYQKDGGHTWSNWRIFLNNLLPLLFK